MDAGVISLLWVLVGVILLVAMIVKFGIKHFRAGENPQNGSV